MYEELTNWLNSLAELIAGNGGSDFHVSAVAAEAVREIAQEAANAIEELSKRVPKTPHGRLIESVELYGRAEDIKAKALSVYDKPQSWQFGVFWAIEQIEAALTNAPTIIRASKEGET